MSEGKSCKSDVPGLKEMPSIATVYGDESFPGGIVNGNQWYPVAGGMQDWNYLHTNCMELTIEIGCVKFPQEKYLPEYWEANKLPIIEFIEQSKIGLIGLVKDPDGNPIKGAKIQIHETFKPNARSHIVVTSSVGDFFRPLLAGNYKAVVFKDGFWNETHYFVLTDEFKTLEMEFTLDIFVEGERKPLHESGFYHKGKINYLTLHDFIDSSGISTHFRFLPLKPEVDLFWSQNLTKLK